MENFKRWDFRQASQSMATVQNRAAWESLSVTMRPTGSSACTLPTLARNTTHFTDSRATEILQMSRLLRERLNPVFLTSDGEPRSLITTTTVGRIFLSPKAMYTLSCRRPSLVLQLPIFNGNFCITTITTRPSQKLRANRGLFYWSRAPLGELRSGTSTTTETSTSW